MERYENLFNDKKKWHEERLRIFQDVNTVWETLEDVYKKSQLSNMMRNKFMLGMISMEDYELYQEFEEDSTNFIDSLIMTVAEKHME